MSQHDILELFLNKIERSSTAQHRCPRHHPQNQLCDCGRHAPKCCSVSAIASCSSCFLEAINILSLGALHSYASCWIGRRVWGFAQPPSCRAPHERGWAENPKFC